MNEFNLDKSYLKGDSGPYVWIIQEWLCLNDIHVVIDGSFGPATHNAIIRFQTLKKLKPDGIVDKKTFSKLIAPLTTAINPIPFNGQSMSDLVVAYANQHLRQHPREIGSRNMGPWIRYYMKGYQGSESPWCAGFTSSIINQAAETLGQKLLMETSDSCSVLANNAKKCGLFLSERTILADKSKLLPGYIYLSREFPGYWTHVGIVIDVKDEVFMSIEGNTNDEGSAEGYEVCRRIRNYDSKDFIIV